MDNSYSKKHMELIKKEISNSILKIQDGKFIEGSDIEKLSLLLSKKYKIPKTVVYQMIEEQITEMIGDHL